MSSALHRAYDASTSRRLPLSPLAPLRSAADPDSDKGYDKVMQRKRRRRKMPKDGFYDPVRPISRRGGYDDEGGGDYDDDDKRRDR